MIIGGDDSMLESFHDAVRRQLHRKRREELATHFKDLQNIDQREVDVYNMIHNTNKTIGDIEDEIKYISSVFN